MADQLLSIKKLKVSQAKGLEAVFAFSLLWLGSTVAVAESLSLFRAGAESLPLLQLQKPLTGQLKGAESLTLRVEAPAGAVLRGRLQALGVVLDVETLDGKHLRRLSLGAGVDHAFTWQSRGSAQERLVLRQESVQGYASEAGGALAAYPAPRMGAYALTLEQVMPVLAASDAPTDAAPQPGQAAQPLRSPLLKALQQWLEQGGDTHDFWIRMSRNGTPLVEPWDDENDLVSFVWRGAQQSVRLFGSPSGNHDPLQQLGRSDVWWSSFVMPRNARLSYGFAPDVPQVSATASVQRRAILSTLQRDPRNRWHWGTSETVRAITDLHDGRSVLSLKNAPTQPWQAKRANVPAGQLSRHWLSSEPLKNGRDVWIYTPQGWGQTPPSERSLLVVFDSHAYLKQVPTSTIVDNLMADGLLPSTAVVLVANAQGDARGRELPPNPVFADFMGEQLMPWLQQQGVEVPAARVALAGSSYGGLAASYVALRHPQRFGNVISLSGSYWWSPKGEQGNWLARQYAQADLLPVRFYIDAGLYEGARGGQAGIRETSQELGDVLRSKGYEVTQREHSTGHDYVHWQGSLACGLIAVLGAKSELAPSAVAQRKVAQACGL